MRKIILFCKMRHIYKLMILLVLISACNQNDTATKTSNKDSLKKNADIAVTPITAKTDTATQVKKDSPLIKLSLVILGLLKDKKIQQLDSFIHPTLGVRFSPYGYVDTLHDQKFTPAKLNASNKNAKKINWGSYDGTGDAISLTLPQYFAKFVYDVDFVNAKKRAINETLSAGTDLNNLQQIYPGCDFTEFYFPGFEAKYDGMDWRSLRLVFKKENERYYLVAIIHGQWTI